MNTTPENLKNRALELMTQARRNELLPEEQEFLNRYLAEHPDAAQEGEALSQLLDELETARVAFRPAHRSALQQRLEQLVREDVLQGEQPAGAGFRRRLEELCLGAARGAAPRRLALMRSLLAIAAGVLVGALLWDMGSKDDERGLTRPNREMANTWKDALGDRGQGLGRPR